MGTDRHENDIRRKDRRPAGRGKTGTNLKDAFAVSNPEEEKEISDRYLDEDETLAHQAKTKHPNRNPDKGVVMKTFILIACILFVSCNQPTRGGDPNRRDSIGDPIDSIDTAGENLYPDSATDTTKLEF